MTDFIFPILFIYTLYCFGFRALSFVVKIHFIGISNLHSFILSNNRLVLSPHKLAYYFSRCFLLIPFPKMAGAKILENFFTTWVFPAQNEANECNGSFRTSNIVFQQMVCNKQYNKYPLSVLS